MTVGNPTSLYQRRNRRISVEHVYPAEAVIKIACAKCGQTPHCSSPLTDGETNEELCQVCHCPQCRGKSGQNVRDVVSFHKLLPGDEHG